MSMRDDNAIHRSATAQAVALLFVGLAFAGFIALGLWQLQRLQWKHDLIARVDSRIRAAAVAAPGPAEWPAIGVERHEYLRVRAEGEYLQDRDTRVEALTELGAGWWLLSPLRTDRDGIVLVNRGFVPAEAAGEAAPPPAGHVRVEGLLRMDEPNGRILRRNDPANGKWYSRDVGAIAQSLGLGGDVAPYFIDADAIPGGAGWPRGGMTVVSFRDHHLQYALTWFALAALCLFAAWRLRTAGRRRMRHHSPHAESDPGQPGH